MCGISGFIDFERKSDAGLLDKMVSAVNYRGPDDMGGKVYKLDKVWVGLGQNRLSILDLSSAGHQPMIYKHLTIVFNGEIYNFQEIKHDLIKAGHRFDSVSDTEVILHAFEEWGSACINRFIGMFAFVILDENTREVTIARDRTGVKPLYYYWDNDLFMFASELKSFHKHPRFKKEINVNAVHQFMDFGVVPAPYCIFKKCSKLMPGYILIFKLDDKEFSLKKYWDVNDWYRLPKLNIDYNEALEEVEQRLITAFNYRMVADVPVGVFLSGGYDSTAVAAILQSTRTNSKIKTFTIGFDEGNNEAPFAKTIAKYIGTEHAEYYCTTTEAQEIIPTLPFYYDEPFADSSAIPTILVSKYARQSVTVALSADGGDEIFAGYTYYNTFVNNLATLKKIPVLLRPVLGNLSQLASILIPNPLLKNKINAIATVLKGHPAKLPQLLHKSYFEISKKNIAALFKTKSTNEPLSFDNDFSEFKEPLSIALATDYSFYLPNDVLTKVDRATMSVSLEGREPFLDQHIIQYVAQLPDKFKYGQTQKKILKDIVHKYVPKQMMDRPKTGFVIPIYSWLRKDLAYLLEEHLSSEKITEAGIFNDAYVQKLKKDFLKDDLYDNTLIWKLLQFQMWYNEWMS